MIKKIISSLVAGSMMTGAAVSPAEIFSEYEDVENYMIFDSKDYSDNIYSYSEDSPLLRADSETIPALEDIPINENIIGLDESVIKVMIDPGHNSYENRSPVYSSYYESVMTWKLSNYLKEELELLGVHADLTKYSLEEKPALLTRGHKSKGYDFFVSIHSNAASSSSVDRPVALCYQNLSWTTIDDTSREIGGLLSSKVAEIMKTNQKGVISQRKSVRDRDGNGVLDDEWYGVLSGARYVCTPGILLEHSFHTNYRATVWLSNDDNLKKLAKGEAEVIYNYFSAKKAEELAASATTTTTTTTTTEETTTTTIETTTAPIETTTEETTTTAVRADPVPKENYILGDVDGDGTISLLDANYVLEYYTKTAACIDIKFIQLENDPYGEELVFNAADIINDRAIDLTDASEILRIYAENAAGVTK